MKENKTQQTENSVEDFLNTITDEKMREACQITAILMQDITQEAPKMWGTSIVGFGTYHYQSTTGRQGDWFKIGFAPRKQNLTFYMSLIDIAQHTEILGRLGKYTTGKSCLYVRKMTDIDITVLKELLLVALSTKA